MTAEGSGPAWRFCTCARGDRQQAVQEQHLHERMLDELTRGAGREQG
jgi:hypothetical protein